MQATPDKDFDQSFQDKFESFEIVPSAGVWKGITAELDKRDAKKSFPVMRVMAAASVLVVLGAGLYLFNPRERVRLQGKPQEEVLVQEQDQSEEVSAQPQPTAVAPAHKAVSAISPIPESKPEIKSADKQPVIAMFQEIPAPQVRENLVPVKEVQLTKQNNNVAQGSENVIKSKIEPSLAFAATEAPPADTGRYLTSQRRSRNSGGGILGSVVNYVVGKVDPREDKLIKFSNDEDGDPEISGINLGLLKMKRLANKQDR